VTEKSEWVLKLNKYQRDNLLWCLRAIGYNGLAPDLLREPLSYLNNGDWVGELYWMLFDPKTDHLEDERPNSPPGEIEDRIAWWFQARIQEMLNVKIKIIGAKEWWLK
jgi:hypothetical protein